MNYTALVLYLVLGLLVGLLLLELVMVWLGR
jgi:hypothetical protein